MNYCTLILALHTSYCHAMHMLHMQFAPPVGAQVGYLLAYLAVLHSLTFAGLVCVTARRTSGSIMKLSSNNAPSIAATECAEPGAARA